MKVTYFVSDTVIFYNLDGIPPNVGDSVCVYLTALKYRVTKVKKVLYPGSVSKQIIKEECEVTLEPE